MCAQPSSVFVCSWRLSLMATDAEILDVTGIAGLRALLSLYWVRSEPVLRMCLVPLMAVGTEKSIMACVARPGPTTKLRLMFGHPTKLMPAFLFVAIGTEISLMACLAGV